MKNYTKILFIVENLPVPFDRRVWQEANALHEAGYQVSIICPKTNEYRASREVLNGIYIYRHPLPVEADDLWGYILEYSFALLWEFYLSWVVLLERGFDVIHACNPPDTIFLIGSFFKFLFGKKFIFDHHDINPELYISKFQRKDLFYKLLLFLEYMTFSTADLVISTNESFRSIAMTRGQKRGDLVFVVRNGPDLKRMKILPAEERYRMGRKYLVGYMGVMAKQDGIDCFMRTIQHIIYELGRSDVHFSLIGGGTELESMKAYADLLGLQGYVTFYGWVTDDVMLGVLNTSDVCIVPDEVNEMNDKSTLAKTMDYMSLEKPIVQFDLKEGRVTAQGAALYAQPNDEKDLAAKILELIDNSELRTQMGKLGRKRIEDELAWSHQIPKLLHAYEALEER
jgi:glycosyltransferase involved in cell wall biosynthesis